MSPTPRWPTTILRYLAPLALVLLVAQYFLGLWTNLYAPSAGFTSNSSSPALDWHYNLGFTLGILGILAIVISAFTRRLMTVLAAVALFIGVLIAGLAGGAFVGNTPNPPNDSLAMGGLFLLAFIAALALAYMAWTRDWECPPEAPAAVAA